LYYLIKLHVRIVDVDVPVSL